MGTQRQLPRAYQRAIMFAGAVMVLQKREKDCMAVVRSGRKRGVGAEDVDRRYTGDLRKVPAAESAFIE